VADEQDPKDAPDAEPTEAAAQEPAKKPARARKAAKAQDAAAEKGAAKAEEPAAGKSAGKAEKSSEEKPAGKAEKSSEEKPAGKAKESSAEKTAAKADKPAGKAKDAAAKKPAAKKAAAKADEQDDDATETPVAESPKRSPAKDQPVARRAAVRAHARYVRTSARKARMVCGHLRGKSVHEARAILAFTPRQVARDWSKLLESAVANAENNHELLEDDLIVREAYADEGPTIKRFRPRAMGRATPIRKRTSHLTITLTPRP
jgi:ribosomal protein L22